MGGTAFVAVRGERPPEPACRLRSCGGRGTSMASSSPVATSGHAVSPSPAALPAIVDTQGMNSIRTTSNASPLAGATGAASAVALRRVGEDLVDGDGTPGLAPHTPYESAKIRSIGSPRDCSAAMLSATVTRGPAT